MSSIERKKYVDMTRYVRDTSRLTIDEAAAVVEGNAVKLAPADTGELKSSIYRKVLSPTEAEVGSTKTYAVYVEFGTRAHDLNSPVNIRNVGWRYIERHPGTPAQPFLRPALDALRSRLARIWSSQSRGFRS